MVTMVVVSVPVTGVSRGLEAVLELFPELVPLRPPGGTPEGPEAVLELFPELVPLGPLGGTSEGPEAVLELFPELGPLGPSGRCFGRVWAVSWLSSPSCLLFSWPSLPSSVVGRGGIVGGKVAGVRSVVVLVLVIDVCLCSMFAISLMFCSLLI